MPKYRTVLHTGAIRKHNTFLKNWANRTKSDELADLILSCIITGGSTTSGKFQSKIVIKGSK